jgi:hypothetical protein
MPTDPRPRLDLAMPVHNEGPSIGRTREQWQARLSPAIDLRLLIRPGLGCSLAFNRRRD